MGETKREDSTADRTSVERPASTEIDPWAPGGAMSVGWAPGPRLVSTDDPARGPDAGSDVVDGPGSRTAADGADTSRTVVGRPAPVTGRTRSPVSPVSLGAVAAVVAVVAVAVVVVVVVGIVVGTGSRDAGRDDADADGNAREASPDLTELAPPSGAGAAAQMPSEPTMTGVGPISWVRVDDDDRSLPLRIGQLAPGSLLGADDTTGRWTSDDGGLSWATTDRVVVEREVGGDDWTVQVLGGETSLWQAADGDDLHLAEVDVASAAAERAEGYGIRTEIVTDGHPIAIADDAYLPVRVRAELPWTEILGTSVGRPFRVEVDVDGRQIRAVSGDFHELPITRFALQDDGSGRVELHDADDVAVWSFVPPGADDDLSTAHVLAGLPITMWTRWDGETFRRLEAPWERTDRVDVAATGDGVVARAVGLDREVRLWRSGDGVTWSEVALPADPADGTPVGVFQGDDEVIVTAFSSGRAVRWATTDGLAFDELPDVPGIDRRARGSFGWVAPPPRSEPQIRVSADGVHWDVVDLRSLLGLDDSRWNVDIDVTVVGTEIFVAVDRPVGRTLLIGTVG